MTKSKTFLQIVLATTITILSVVAIASATTIGTNISTSGNLQVSGIATSTTLVANPTFQVFGTTDEGTGTFIQTHASTTSLLTGNYYGTNGLYFKKYDGTTWAGLERLNYMGAGYINFMILKQLAGDLATEYLVVDSSDNTITDMGVGGIILGADTSDTASGKYFLINSPDGIRFVAMGSDGDVLSIGNGVFGDIDTSANARLVSTSTGEQLRLIYDETNNQYASFTVDSGGDLTLDLAATNATTTISDNLVISGNASSTGYLSVATIQSETGTTTFTNSDIYLNNGSVDTLYFANNADIVGIGANGPGWRLNDSSGNFAVGAGLIPGVATGLALQSPAGAASVIHLNDSDGNNVIALTLDEEGGNSDLQFVNTTQSPDNYLRFIDTQGDYWSFSYDETDNILRGWGDTGDGAAPGLCLGSETADSSYGLSTNDVVIAQDLEVQGNTYLGTTGIGTGTPATVLDIYSSATTTATIDSSSISKGGCLKIRDIDGAGYSYCTTLNGTMTCSTISCE